MSLLDNINTLNTWANACRTRLWNVEDNLDWRTISAYNLSSHGGVGWVAYYNRLVLSELIEAMQYFVYGYSSSFNYVYWVNVHQGLYEREADITWKSICEAWLANDFEGRVMTIAMIDRMRQLIWDEPFYIAWAARPEQQEF